MSYGVVGVLGGLLGLGLFLFLLFASELVKRYLVR